MHVSHPIRLFVSVILGIAICITGYTLVTRYLVKQMTILAPSENSTPVTVVSGRKYMASQKMEPSLPHWAISTSNLKAELDVALPKIEAPAPSNMPGVLSDRTKTGLPNAEVLSPEFPPVSGPEEVRVQISAPALPAVALPHADISRPQMPPPDVTASLAPPGLPLLAPSLQPGQKSTALPVDTPPEVEIITP
jgi:hypothetical protein